MLLTPLLLQASLLFTPLHREAEPPELRAAEHIVLMHDEVEGLAHKPGRTREQALELAADLTRLARGGADFAMLAQRYSDAGPRARVLGSFVQGALSPELDAFLFAAEPGACSDPLATPGGVIVLRRIDTHAAVRTILIDGTDDAARDRAKDLATRLRAGEDFGALATEHSDDAASAARAGRFAVFERGPRDVLLKAAAFELRVGEWAGPIESPVGLHFLLREEPDDYPAELRESNFARLSTILIRHSLAGEGASQRDPDAARELANSVWRLVQEGRSFEDLAAAFDEDTGGKDRAGDLGWVHRRSPGLQDALAKAFLLEPGETLEPQSTSVGYLIVRRAR